MKSQIFTAIIFTKSGTALKYRNIRNYSRLPDAFYNPKFMAFVASKDGTTVNLYYKDDKTFFKQIKTNP